MQPNNRQIKESAKKASLSFQPVDCKITKELKVDKNLSAVVFLGDNFKKEISSMINEFKPFGKSIIINPADKYHFTIFNWSLDQDFEQITSTIKDAMKQELAVDFSGLFIGDQGVAIAGYSKGQKLIDLRRKLFKITSREFPENFWGYIVWVSLYKYSQKPPQELLEITKKYVDKNFGEFKISKIDIFEVEHRHLEGAKKLLTVK